MNHLEKAEAALRSGNPTESLAALQAAVRERPAEARLRIFLFQLLCVLGQWERALNQLQVCGQLDASTEAMVRTYREAIRCESLRAEVFAGKRTPMLFGQPEPWTALLIEALLRAGRGESEAAATLRAQALEQAPAIGGMIDGEAFEWLSDGDSRLGPVLEAVVNGKYYWIPFERLASVMFDAPSDLRDMVWAPATLEFVNGGQAVALVPTRYAGTIEAGDAPCLLARATQWQELGENAWAGIGQRQFVSDVSDRMLLDTREIVFTAQAASAQAEPEATGQPRGAGAHGEADG